MSQKKKCTSSERPLPPEYPSNNISVVISSNSRHYRVFEKKCNPLLFKILQKIIRFESIWGIPPECTIYVLSNGIQVEWINWIFHCLIDVFASTAYFRCRNVIGNLHRRQSTFVRAYFYHYLQIHLMTLKLSSSIHKACITSSASRPEILWKHVFHNFWQEKGVCSNGMLHLKLTNLMMNNSINVSKLHMTRQKKDCTFRWYTLRLLKFCHFLNILNHWVAFFPETPCRLMAMSPLYPCGKPCSTGPHNQTVKNLAPFSAIMASNLNPVGALSILQSNWSNRKFYHIYTVITIVIHKSRNLIGT